MFLSKIVIHSCVIIHYIVGENIFVLIVYKLLEQQMYWNVLKYQVKDCFDISGKQRIKILTKGKGINLKNCESKIKFFDLCIF